MSVTTLPLTLFGFGAPEVQANWKVERSVLDPCCWIDHGQGFLAGAEHLLFDLEEAIDWYRGRRLMYGTWFDEPRRTGTEALPDRVLPDAIASMRSALSAHYDMAFRGLFCNFYETGSDKRCMARRPDWTYRDRSARGDHQPRRAEDLSNATAEWR